MKLLKITALAVLCAASLSAKDAPAPAPELTTYPPRTEIVIKGGTKIFAEVAQTTEEHEKGLMFRKALAPTAGMIFVFPEQRYRAFWMKNTLIPLDIIFMDKNAKILQIFKAVPASKTDTKDEDVAIVRGVARYVLEVNAGFADKYSLKTGEKVNLGFPAPAPVEEKLPAAAAPAVPVQ